jgi:type VI secretion system secreted protein Hcp
MAVDMFIKIGDVKGESKDSVHKEEIDVLAWSWGMSNSGSAQFGTGAGAGKANVQDLSFTKYIDKSSMNLMQACCKGTHFPEVKLTVRKAGDKPLEYLTLTLTEAIITGVSTGGSGGEDRLTENVTINFAEFVTEYKEQLKEGGAGASSFAKYKMTENVSG